MESRLYKQQAPATIDVQLLLSITGIFWLIAKVASYKLWVTERFFPTVPPFDFLSVIPSIVHWLLLLLSISLLLVLIIKPLNKTLQVSLLVTELSSCLLDQNRWQPWEYLYLFVLLIFILNKNKPSIIATCFIIMLATVYFYSGLHKFNEGFVNNVWETLFLKRYLKIHGLPYQSHWLHFTGFIFPVIECLAGICLLFTKTKKIAAVTLIAMHLIILIVIGPLGIHYNKIVWPWNAAMIFYLYLIFIKGESNLSGLFILMDMRNKIILACWAILPAFNFIGLWDNYLSWNIYSSSLPNMLVCIKDTSTANALGSFVNNNDPLKICNGDALLNIQRWAMKEMSVPPYPEERVYEKIKKHWIRNYPLSNATFIIYYYPFKPGLSPYEK